MKDEGWYVTNSNTNTNTNTKNKHKHKHEHDEDDDEVEYDEKDEDEDEADEDYGDGGTLTNSSSHASVSLGRAFLSLGRAGAQWGSGAQGLSCSASRAPRAAASGTSFCLPGSAGRGQYGASKPRRSAAGEDAVHSQA